MLAAAQAAHPDEACGILLGDTNRIARFIETRNVHPDPRSRFEIEPRALIDAHRRAREGGAGVAGYFHSHPHGSPEPSATDAAMAAHDGRIWAIAGMVQGGVRGERDVRFWRDGETGFTPLPYTLDTG